MGSTPKSRVRNSRFKARTAKADGEDMATLVAVLYRHDGLNDAEVTEKVNELDLNLALAIRDEFFPNGVPATEAEAFKDMPAIKIFGDDLLKKYRRGEWTPKPMAELLAAGWPFKRPSSVPRNQISVLVLRASVPGTVLQSR